MAPKTMLSGRRRDDIDTIRAIACIALVSFHTVGGSPVSGMALPADHALSRLNEIVIDFRMPMFSFVSGFMILFLTSQYPVTNLGQAISSKARRLLLPMLSVGTLFWLARDLTGASQQPLWTIPFLPFAHFWFLQATFVIMVSFLLLNWATGGRHVGVAAALMTIGLIAWLILPSVPVNILSIRQAFYLMIFFAGGLLLACAAQRFEGDRIPIRGPARRSLGVALVVVISIGVLLAYDVLVVPDTLRSGLGVALGLAFCPILFMLRPSNRALAYMGRYSFAIYLFHVFFTAGTRDAIGAITSDAPLVMIWIIPLIAGLIGPILVQKAIVRSQLASFVLLGLRWRAPQSKQATISFSHTARPMM